MRSTEPGVLAATILGSSMVFIDATVVNVILPRLQTTLNVTGVQIQWVVEAYLLFLSALILLGGALGDRFGRKRIFQLGTILFVIASVACGLSQTLFQLTLARSVQGIGGALLTPGSLAIINAAFPEQERGKAIGTWSGFTAITAALGPVLGGWLSDYASWRWVFFLNLPLALITLATTQKYVPEQCDESRNIPLDIKGAVTSTLALAGITFGLIESGRLGFQNFSVCVALIGGILLLGLFIRIESRSTAPMMPLSLFRSRVFSAVNLLTLLLYAALGAVFYFLPFNLIQVQGFSATQAGAANLPFVLILFLMSRWSGGLYDRFGASVPLTVGSLIAGTGFLVLGYLPGLHADYWTAFFPGIIILGVGMAICIAPLTTAVLAAVQVDHSGLASGINNAIARIAGLLAIATLTLFIVFSFQRNLSQALETIAIPPELSSEIIRKSNRLAALEIPAGTDPRLKRILERTIGAAYLKSFQELMVIAALLATAGASTAFFAIKDGTRPNKKKA